MKFRTVIAAIGIAAFGSTAMAADVPVVVPTTLTPVAGDAETYSWRGFFVGAQYAHLNSAAGAVGYNFAAGAFVLGLQVEALYAAQLAAFGGGASVRLGMALGPRDRFLAYGRAGGYFVTGLPAVPVRIVAGGELAIGERFSVFAEAGTNLLVAGGAVMQGGLALGAGVNLHFGR